MGSQLGKWADDGLVHSSSVKTWRRSGTSVPCCCAGNARFIAKRPRPGQIGGLQVRAIDETMGEMRGPLPLSHRYRAAAAEAGGREREVERIFCTQYGGIVVISGVVLGWKKVGRGADKDVVYQAEKATPSVEEDPAERRRGWSTKRGRLVWLPARIKPITGSRAGQQLRKELTTGC